MNQRVMNIVALVAVSGVVVGGAVVYIAGRLNPPLPVSDVPASAYQPSLSPAPPAPQPAGDPSSPPSNTSVAVSAQKPVASIANEPAQPPPPPRIYTWAEIEEKLDKIRASRNTSADYWSVLSGAYAELSNPKFTGSKDYPEHIKKLNEWRREFPQSPSPLVVEARTYVHYAWDARGIGMASTVSEIGWELYAQRIEEAHRLLIESLKLGAKDGEVYTQLVQIAKASSLPLEQAQAWVEEGRQLDPTYFQLYCAMADYLLPRWHGQPGDIERFAAELVEKLPGDDGLVAFALVAKAITYYDCPDHLSLFWGQYDRELLTKAAEALVKRHPQWPQAASFAAMCTLATQDHAAARRIRPSVGDYDPQDRIWVWKNSHRKFLDWSARESTPGGEDDWVWGTHFHYGGIGFARNPHYIWCGQGGYGGLAATLLDLKTKGVRAVLPAPDGHLHDLVFDNRHNWALASFGHGGENKFTGIVLWDATNSEILLTHSAAKPCRTIAINPGASQVAWSEMRSVHLHDVEKGESWVIELKEQIPQKLVFSPEGNLLIVEALPISVWDAKTGEHRRDLPSSHLKSPDGLWFEKVLDIDEEGRILVTAIHSPLVEKQLAMLKKKLLVRLSADWKTWDVVISDLEQHGRMSIHAATVSPDRRWLAVPQMQVRGQERIDLWDLRSGMRATSFGGHWNHIGQLAFSGDGERLASISQMGGPIKIWSLANLESE